MSKEREDEWQICDKRNLDYVLNHGNNACRFACASSRCNHEVGTVLNVMNEEFFMIEVCDEVKTFEELSFCYGIIAGDTVMFEWDYRNCDVVSFTVVRTGVQCGVWCP